MRVWRIVCWPFLWPSLFNTTGLSIISAVQGVPAGKCRQLTKCDGSGKTWGDDGQIRLLARRGERRPGRKTVWLAELSTAAGVAVHTVADPGRPGPSSTAGCSCKNTSQRVSHTTASLAWTFCRHLPLSLQCNVDRNGFLDSAPKLQPSTSVTFDPNPNRGLIIDPTVLWPRELVQAYLPKYGCLEVAFMSGCVDRRQS